MKKILIDLTKLKYPYTGLGNVSFFQLKYFQKLAPKFKDLQLSFLLPKNYKSNQNQFNIIFSTNIQKFIPIGQKFDIWYWNNQDTKYKGKAQKYVLTIHDLNIIWEKKGWKLKKRLKAIVGKIQKAQVIAYISNFTKQTVHKYLNISGKQEYVIYNGVEVDKNNIQPIEIPTQKPYLFTIGGVREKKNFKVLIPFMNLAKDFALIIAGDKNTRYAIEIQNLIKKYNLQNRVFLIGIVSEAQKNFLFKNAYAFVYPSLYEGFGLPVIEAMLWQKPVFCSNKTSLPEIAGDYAFYWHNFQPDYMYDVFQKGLNFFFKNPHFKNDMLKFANRYSWENNVLSYLKIFDNL